MQNTVVVQFTDKTILKGTTSDFVPKKNMFHVLDVETGETKEVHIANIKAVFFVKTYDGDKDRVENPTERNGLGKKIAVHFNDGEIMHAYASSYVASAPGFFVFPSDPEDNNDRIFVVNASTKEVRFQVTA